MYSESLTKTCLGITDHSIINVHTEYLISTPLTMDMDSDENGELCVEIEELPPDTTPEFNVTFYLVDPQANVRCPVQIIDETDGTLVFHLRPTFNLRCQ